MFSVMSLRTAACAACCVLAIGAVPIAYAAPTYSVTDLGVFGLDNINIGDINNAGEIVGWGDGNSGYRSFLSDTATNTLGTLGGANSKATGINDSGWITGFSTTPGNANFRAFLYRNGNAQDIGTLGGNQSYAYSINDGGQIAGGSSITGNAAIHPFLYDNGSMLDLGTLGGASGFAYGMNNSGAIVGSTAISGDTIEHAFLYSNGSMSDLGSFGGELSRATDINNTGQIVGYSYTTGNTAVHAFLYDNGGMVDIGTLGGNQSYAFSINSAGRIVGDSDGRAFLYSDGTMFDLNDLIDPSGGWILQDAAGINDIGQIAVVGVINGTQHALLLNPISEPATLALLAVGLAGVGFGKRRY